MKNNLIKYIFIIFAIGIMIFAFYKIKKDETNKNNPVEQTAISEEEIITEMNLGIAEFDTINPILSNNKNVQEIAKLIYEPLINLTEDYKTQQCLATEWAKVNDTTYIIKIREDVRWSNGDKFTGEDVRFTIDKLKEIHSIYSYNVQYVTGVEVSDGYTVTITLEKEVPFFEYNLIFPIMCKSYYEGEDFVNTEKNNIPIGTGMYRISNVKDDKITLKPNEDWWNKEEKQLKMQQINIKKYNSVAELYNNFKSGNVDIISTANINVQDHIGTIGYNYKEFNGREFDFIAFNTQNYLLSKSEIRKAIAYSIDRENIISSIFNNKYYLTNTPIEYGTWLNTEKNTSLGYNTEQAIQILEENGWKFSFNYWRKLENFRIQKLSFNLVVKMSDLNRVAVAENIKAQLENQGFRINIIKANDGQYTNYLQNKNYDMILGGTYISANPDLTTYFGEGNLANYNNEEVKSILQEVKNTTDEAILKEKYERLVEIYNTEIPYIGLYTNKHTVAYSTELVGSVQPNWFNIFYNIENWYK